MQQVRVPHRSLQREHVLNKLSRPRRNLTQVYLTPPSHNITTLSQILPTFLSVPAYGLPSERSMPLGRDFTGASTSRIAMAAVDGVRGL